MPLKDSILRKEYYKKYYKDNKGRLIDKARHRYANYSDVRKLVNAAKQRAKMKNLEFDITPNDIDVPEFCPILGEKLIKHTRYAPSIDRIDSTRGYTKDNVWIISRRANLMKNDATVEDLKRFAEWAIKL